MSVCPICGTDCAGTCSEKFVEEHNLDAFFPVENLETGEPAPGDLPAPVIVVNNDKPE
jgi:hypothetical protein